MRAVLILAPAMRGLGHGHLNEPLTDPARSSIERILGWLESR